MMQELRPRGANGLSEGTVSGRSFQILFTLAGSNSTDAKRLQGRIGLETSEFDMLIEGLNKRYLVDVVSSLEGTRVTEKLRLTEEGEATLLRSLERMCELPEKTAV